MEASVYNAEGKVSGTIALPSNIFDLPWNGGLVRQVTLAMQANARTPVAHARTRGEVRGGGKKPWQQKGTGRARHGSIRSPLWRGGGVTFGPRNDKRYDQKINRKMRAKALLILLSRKLKDNEIIFVELGVWKEPKTARAKDVLTALSKAGFEALIRKNRNAALIALGVRDENLMKSFRNFGNLSLEDARSLNPVELLNHKYLVMVSPKEAIETLAQRAGGETVVSVVSKTETASKKKGAPQARKPRLSKKAVA
jgi:large subunit ribosomal protein L4